jgi:membrane-associated protein
MAGVAEMPYRRFLPYSVCGGAGWVLLCAMLGYGLGSVPLVKQNFDKAILLVIFISLIPVFIETYKARRGH